ncbi:rhamnan synthesis F family protein [Methylobacterium sp. J-026]|uniref:rhamnan synthesis F family protein n=1 Tax=Methylobacterium sp. J-026 TaxID=2836624 RepID=UPI001FBBE333|nr:rhamnan synthesis F family protein [Methylobacterium sp. J-026]MCJ2136341.1 rhamnan synthesis F family protein [Methylobacterium sp. J-026]
MTEDARAADSRSGPAADLHGAFDRDWYTLRYPDVASAQVDPGAHYATHGQAEGRYPNPEAEMRALGESVDPAWYRARYPDVAATGADPVRHYLLYGRAEGRFPNADREPREVWNTRFDPTWYRARNADLGPYRDDPLEHFRRIGLLEGRAANAAEEDRAVWHGIFDPDWYRARNPDVARRGLDPLEHFLTEGLVDRRRPNPHAVLASEPVTAARLDRLRGGAFAAEVALFVTHTSDGAIKPHVVHHVTGLQRCGIACALIVVCDDGDAPVTGPALDRADHVFRRTNAGFDFAAWAHVLRRHPELFGAEILYLVNDSVFGPTSPEALERVVARIRTSAADLVGLTDNADRGWHVQSYFLALKQRFLGSAAGRAFFAGVVAYTHKNDVVNEYETQLARHATARGLRAEVLFPTPDWLDATLHNWRRLLRAGFPYLKVGTARALVPDVETTDWRAEMAMRGYDTAPADATLAQLARAGAGDDAERRIRAEMHAFLAAGATIDLTPGAAPLVSVLAVLDGRPARFLHLIRVLAERRRASGEVVIVDNAAIDDTHHVLGRLAGATILTHVAPLPPLRAARRALAQARGGIVVLWRPEAGRACGPEAPAGAGAADGQPLRDRLEQVWPAGDGLRIMELQVAADASWCALGLEHHGDHLGVAYAMWRHDASRALAQLIDLLEPSPEGDVSDPNVL